MVRDRFVFATRIPRLRKRRKRYQHSSGAIVLSVINICLVPDVLETIFTSVSQPVVSSVPTPLRSNEVTLCESVFNEIIDIPPKRGRQRRRQKPRRRRWISRA